MLQMKMDTNAITQGLATGAIKVKLKTMANTLKSGDADAELTPLAQKLNISEYELITIILLQLQSINDETNVLMGIKEDDTNLLEG